MIDEFSRFEAIKGRCAADILTAVEPHRAQARRDPRRHRARPDTQGSPAP
ncbi:hypothetical protein [Streptomyces sp. SM11]|nr:hypothetical protein [Streptomyces sp. SM11]